MGNEIGLTPAKLFDPSRSPVKGLAQVSHFFGSPHIQNTMKFSLAYPEQSLDQFFEWPAHPACVHVGEKNGGHDAPQAQPAHRASSRHRLVTRSHGFAYPHFLTEAYQFINLGSDLLADLIFFLIPGTLGGKSRA